MAPDVDFELSEEGFRTYATRLAAHGIQVRPQSRHTTEDLVRGGTSVEEVSGILVYNDCEYIYHVSRQGDFYYLYVDISTHGAANAGNLSDLIERAFPNSTQPRLKLAPQKPRRKIDKDWFITRFGCVGCLAFVLAILFLAAVGFRTLFFK